MTDLTPALNVHLEERQAVLVRKRGYDLQKINSFLQEAYSINARIADLTRELRSTRPAYLATAPPSRRRRLGGSESTHDRARPLTDRERDAIDGQSKLLLRQLNSAITDLKQAEDVRAQTADSIALSKRARGGLGALGRWAAGGAVTAKSPEEEIEEAERNTVAICRESVIKFLQAKLEEAGRVQGEMMEVRLSREIEKSKSILHKSQRGAQIPYAQDDDDDHNNNDTTAARPTSSTKWKRTSTALSNGDPSSPSQAPELSQEQAQLFAQENHDLLRQYEDQMDQMRTAERSILEISELHATLHANLEQQSEHIDQLVQDSYSTTENLGKGNKELKRASERRSTAQAVFYSTCAFCSFLVLWDFVF